MTTNFARLIAGPLVAAGMAAGALGLAVAANADDSAYAAPDLTSAHIGPTISSGPPYRPGEHYNIPGGINYRDFSTPHNVQ